jgi:hypothetical protein
MQKAKNTLFFRNNENPKILKTLIPYDRTAALRKLESTSGAYLDGDEVSPCIIGDRLCDQRLPAPWGAVQQDTCRQREAHRLQAVQKDVRVSAGGHAFAK